MFDIVLACLSTVAVYFHPAPFGVVLMVGVILAKFARTTVLYYMETRMPILLPGENLPEKIDIPNMALVPEFRKGQIRDILIATMDLMISLISVFYLVVLLFYTLGTAQSVLSLLGGILFYLVVRMNITMLFLAMRKTPTFSVKAKVVECHQGELVKPATPFGVNSQFGTNIVAEGAYYDVEYDGEIYKGFKQTDAYVENIKPGDSVVFFSLDGKLIDIAKINTTD